MHTHVSPSYTHLVDLMPGRERDRWDVGEEEIMERLTLTNYISTNLGSTHKMEKSMSKMGWERGGGRGG